MPTFAFWNVNANVPAEMIIALAQEWDVDILVLAECQADPEFLVKLNESERRYYPDPGESNRLTILTLFRSDLQCLVRDSPGVAIRHYGLADEQSFLMAAVHLDSKLWRNTEDQVFAAVELANEIREAEDRFGHTRTIVIGDLNMNPFESGVVGSLGLHGVMDRRIAAGESRMIRGKSHKFFYNPMWSKFGDADESPAGTYFYNSGSEVNYFWNVFDQVLVRPALLSSLPQDCVSIVTRVRGVSLLTDRGRPDQSTASDDLPIICRMNEIQEAVNGEEFVG